MDLGQIPHDKHTKMLSVSTNHFISMYTRRRWCFKAWLTGFFRRDYPLGGMGEVIIKTSQY